MNETDYSSYSYKQLIDVLNNIDHQKHSEKIKLIESLLPEKKLEFEENEKQRIAQEKEDNIKNAYEVVNALGFLQLAASALILIVLVYYSYQGQSFSVLTIILAVLFSVLNFISGYTTIKQKTKLYWISILNQSLQVLSLSIGKLYLAICILRLDIEISSRWRHFRFVQNLVETGLIVKVA